MRENGRHARGSESSHHPGDSYYNIPPIKRPHWTWEIFVYFWVGGIGAGAHAVTTIARLLGHGDAALLRAGRYITLGSMVLSPLLLISDLGRPERFYNMLRILKLRSPMSLGSWSLFLFGSLSGLIATAQAAQDGLLGGGNPAARLARAVPAQILSALAMPFALFVGSYGGILLAATAVPMWARNALLMGPTFLASSFSTGLSALSLALKLGRWGEKGTHAALRRAERLALVAELGLMAASLAKMGKYGKPLYGKPLAPLFFGGTVLGGILAPLALLSGRESRPRGILASVLVLLGGLAFRYVMVEGGKRSADDPQATFSHTRKEG
ncbi:polysulfide reductase [Rubrobacter taiwanensis]|uniref:Polysulfide reductase n=1 Tax=Rubrobacter taiwanensis TaxID=185139 RepID=A0A4R1BQV4_9ACTN|nr:NrfD/PsrC family molybdoenzyme membrane anchor subunit [Rubrobacter taiwanensis]TCJ20001.1 polysulfide reductase [Rubrobacter taiwanensis]